MNGEGRQFMEQSLYLAANFLDFFLFDIYARRTARSELGGDRVRDEKKKSW